MAELIGMHVETAMRTPEELVELGYARSRVVLVNEAHDGWLRCVRTREVGRRILPVALAAGARHLAMEALWSDELAREANRTRRAPEGERERIGYLAQTEMRSLVQSALDLGFKLAYYEAEFEEVQGPDEDGMSREVMNRRDAVQARKLAGILASLPADGRLLVWCGNGHLWKTPTNGWIPMAVRLREHSGMEPFSIDQTRSVDVPGLTDPAREAVEHYEPQLRAMGGTGGWLSEDAPEGLRRDSEDALLLSIENELE